MSIIGSISNVFHAFSSRRIKLESKSKTGKIASEMAKFMVELNCPSNSVD